MSFTHTNQAQRTNAANLGDDPHGLEIYEEKPNVDHLETSSIVEEKTRETSLVGDYSGFTQKTDPKEIKLVRKLDLYIMVGTLVLSNNRVLDADSGQTSLWSMYWLNYLDRNAIALAKRECLSYCL